MTEELERNTCPKCGDPTDNGHDRELPPNPYVCTKCEQELELPRKLAMYAARAVYEEYRHEAKAEKSAPPDFPDWLDAQLEDNAQDEQ